MIQRIQSLYLFVVTALFVVLLFTPAADFTPLNPAAVPTDGGSLTMGRYVLLALAAIVALIALCSIFLYKKRELQIKLSVVNLILMVAYYPVLFIYLLIVQSSYNLNYHFHLAVMFPLISAVITYLAIRAIRKDEELVRSLDRLR